MSTRHRIRVLAATVMATVLTTSGCAFQGLNSLPLPGTVGRGDGAITYYIELTNISTLEQNSPVMVDDVVVGAVGRMTVRDWHANVEVSVKPDVIIPANAAATIGQTSLLGSMHLALDPPVGQSPTGRLAPGSTIGVNRSSAYPSTERTLSSLSVVINGGGLGQAGDIVREFNAMFNGRQGQLRDLLQRLDEFVGVLTNQRDQVNATINALDRLSATFAGQSRVIDDALRRIPPALDVLIEQRPQITAALQKLGTFSSTATALINDTQADLVRNLTNLEPTLRALADVGPDLGTALSYAPTFPYGQSYIDRAIRGDYVNQFLVFDFTVPRLKRGLMLGTRWGQEGLELTPAPGDPWFSTYTRDPLTAPVTPAPSEVAGVPPLVDVIGGTATPGEPEPEAAALPAVPPPAGPGGN